MSVTREDVAKIAGLARLELSPDEMDAMASQMDTILGYVAKLDEIDGTDIKPTTHVLDIVNSFRDDVVQPSLSQAEALANGPDQNGEAFVVPRIL
jgi:aspartyl-tRNA(Asn)/glutamyl-tRNA(Gln) amidotransferase subunit C